MTTVLNNFKKSPLLFCLTLLLVLGVGISCNDITTKKVGEAYNNPNGRNDRWGFIGPGGGGAMFNPTINPLDSTNVFVSCDMTGSFVTYDGGEKWRMFNLRGKTEFFVFDGKNEKVAYAGTSNLLFKSIDQGKSWNTIYPEPKNIIAIHAQGDHAGEVVVTKDSIRTQIKKLVVDPGDPEKLFLLVKRTKVDVWPIVRGKQQRFYMEILTSGNGGKQWTKLDKLWFDLNTIFLDPTSPSNNRTIYVCGKDGLGVKTDGGWRKIEIPEGSGSITQVVDGWDMENQRHIIYVLSGKSYFNREGKPNDPRIYRTENGGLDWTRVDGPLLDLKGETLENPEFRSIATSYKNPNTLYVSFNGLKTDKTTTSFGVAKTTDSGRSWELVWNDTFSALDDKQHASSNRTQGWLDKRFGPGWGENPFHMAVDDNDPLLTYATDFGRTIKTTDGGNTWKQVYTKKVDGVGWRSRGLQVTTGYMLAFDPFDPQHVFMADTDTGLMESIDGGKSWNSATHNNGVPRRWINSTYWLLFDPDVKDRIWAVMSANHDLPRPKMWRNRDMDSYRGGVLISNDGGKSWKPISKSIGETAATHILMDRTKDGLERTLYVCAFGKGVYKSVDSGASWEAKNNGILGSQPAAWRLTQRKNGDMFLIVSRKSDNGSIGNELDGALYKSRDGAETWEKVNLPEGVNGPTSIIVDPENQKRLILSAWGRYGATPFAPNRGGGIYISEDDGGTWKAVLTEDQHIHDVTMDERNGILYASGFNSSAYRSDDRGVTWQRIKGYNFKWGKRVQPDPYDSEKIYVITFGGGVWYGPAKGDPNAREDIATPIASYGIQ